MSVLVIGGGISGLGALRLLRSRGKSVVLYDDRISLDQIPRDCLGEHFTLTRDPHYLGQLGEFEQIVVSPGFPRSHDIWTVLAAQTRGKPQKVISELDLGLQLYQGNVLGVTGTNGKSTTTAMIHHLLNETGHPASIGGNFGISVCELLATKEIKPSLALEVSSYQLEDSFYDGYRVSVFTNFTPDHLSRHGSLENYFRAKWKIFSSPKKDFQGFVSEEVYELAQTLKIPLPKNIRALTLDSRLRAELNSKAQIQADTNSQNAMFALYSVGESIKEDPLKLVGALKNFKGLPHRFQTIRTFPDGRKIINDSKATNVASTLAALKNLSRPCVLLMGGLPKEERFSLVCEYSTKIKTILAFGKAAPLIQEDLGGSYPVEIFENLSELLEHFRKDPEALFSRGHDVLLSPACASQDEFKNFEERGSFFTKKIEALFPQGF